MRLHDILFSMFISRKNKYLVGIYLVFAINLNIIGQDTSDTACDSINIAYHTKYLVTDSVLNKPAVEALSHYPELDSTHIIFKYKSMPWMMAARPATRFIFQPRKKRTYFILVSTNEKMNADTIIKLMPYEAKVGILGHEMAHISDYEDMNRIELLFFGIKYVICTRKVEKQTDLKTIEHGLGDELLEYNEYIMENKFVTEKYLRKRARNYMKPDKIKKTKRKHTY